MAVNRITGMVSGMDTDQLVKDLMKIEQARYDKVDIEKQYVEWKQEAYRTTISTIDAFQSEYFDILKGDTYMMSPSSLSAFSSTTLINGEESTHVTVTGSVDANNLTHTISKVQQLATEDHWYSAVTRIASINSGPITSGASSTIEDIKAGPLKFDLSIDGNTKTIEITDPELSAINTVDDLVSALNTEITNVFGAGYTDVVSKFSDSGDDFIKFDQAGSTVGIYSVDGSSILDKIGIQSGETNTAYEKSTIQDLFGIGDSGFEDFEINGVQITDIEGSDTVEDFMYKVNKANAGVQISFSSLDNRFELKSTSTGAVNNIDIEEGSNADAMFDALGFASLTGDGTTDDGYRVSGQNAIIVLDDETIVKASNSFSVEGVGYTLNSVYTDADPIDIKITNNTDQVYDKIKNFVEDYNGLVLAMNVIVDEKKNRDYDPLTAEQKKSLSEDQIEDWETEAKKGLLKNDSNIISLLDEMRRAFYEPVEGSGMTLSEMGITTSSNYKDNGKLVIDEDKLKDALKNNYTDVVTLFTKESDNRYLEEGTAAERYAENGLMNRLDDIINNQIRTSRDSDGNKGFLVEKAGVVGDASVANNALSKELLQYESRLDLLLDLLSSKETAYYAEFSRMETALARLQSQSASLASTIGG
jgi:flagellar hook-associated protein 2